MLPTRIALGLLAAAVIAACAKAPEPAASTVAPTAAVEPAAAPAQAEAPEPDEADEVVTAGSGVQFSTIAETFLTASTPDDNVDSPASWRTADGATWVIATAKATDRLIVYDGDTGRTLRTVGGTGDGAGQFNRPNGVFVIDDLAFVVERDNRRVQVLRLPGFEPLGTFGSDALQQPYGLWVRRQGDGYEALVTDAYMSTADEDVPPPLAELDRRIKRYEVKLDGSALHAVSLGSFGDTSAAGAIRVPESIWGDEANARLLIAEEDQPTGTRLRVYGMDHRYAGRDVGAGLFHAQAEGIALWACPDGSGYWLATDQYKDRSLFHVFDRQSLEHLGAFAGNTIANTDGVWLQQGPTPAFPAGVFYAVNDDQGVGAFDWRQVAATLKLRERCD